MKIIIISIIAICIFGLFAFRYINSIRSTMAPSDLKIDASIRSTVTENLIKELNDGYIFAETAQIIEGDLSKRLKNGEYDVITDSRMFAEKLAKDLQLISKDKHLRVRYSAEPLPLRVEKNEPTPEEKAEAMQFFKRINFGFEKVECMQGNIGYINLHGFYDPEAGAETVAAAMTFISNTESLIFDLRQNGGGDPAMVALVSSYLFGDEPVHLNDLYWRKENKTEEFWTKPNPAGKKFGNKDVYVLTSSYTFSAAEEFCYNLKNLKRATIIGETTHGGAHPGNRVRLNEHFDVFIPRGRAINPITKTNWEGTGVIPDIQVPKEHALKIAYVMALTKSVETIKDKDTKDIIRQLIKQNQTELDQKGWN